MADDPKTPESWTTRHFSQANLKGPGQRDVPALLRRVADSIQGLGAVNIQDLTFGTEITEDGPWRHLTVYFHPEEAATVGEG